MIKPIEISEIPSINHGDIMEDIEEFAGSDADACEIANRDNRPAISLHSSYYSAAKKSGHAIKVMRRKERVFLVRGET